MNLKTRYRVIATSLIAAGVLSACNSATSKIGGGQTVTASPINAKQTVRSLFTQNSQLNGSLEITGSTAGYYLSGAKISLTNSGSTPIDLSKSTISFTSQDSNGEVVKVDVDGFNNWHVASHGTGYKISFMTGNGTVQLGSVKTSNGSAPIINAGETIVFTGNFVLNNHGFDTAVAISSFSLDGVSPSPEPSPAPSPSPAGKCDGIAVWDASKVFTGGQKVQYNGEEYSAKWWTQGDKPNSSNNDGPWKFEQKCDASPVPTPSPSPSPEPVADVGELDVIVDTTDTNCKGTSLCQGLTVHVKDTLGQDVTVPIVVPDSSLGGVFTQPIKNLQANVAYSVTTDSIKDTTVAYDPAIAKQTVVKNSTVKISAKYTKVAPDVATGKATITVPNVVPNYKQDVQVDIINAANSNAVVGTYLVKQGTSFTTANLPISDSKNQYLVKMSKGIADPKAGLYYVESGTPQVVITKDQNTNLTLPLIKSTKILNKVTLTLGGLEDSDSANVSFDDAVHTFAYVNDSAAKNGSLTYYVESGLNFGLSISANGSTSYEKSQFGFTGLVDKDLTYVATFKKQSLPAVEGTYDFAMPSGSGSGIDYSGKFQIKLNPKTTVAVDTITFTSNVPNLDQIALGYGNFYSTEAIPKWSKTTDTVTGLTAYKLEISQKDWSGKTIPVNLSAGGTLSFTWAPDGTGMTFDKVVPIISQVKVNGSSFVIDGACTTCIDPGKGKQIVGYQEQWSVYSSHQYMPEDIPFNNLNTINYGFVDFATPKSYPWMGSGKYGIVTADGGADYRQLVALWKEKQRKPYLKVVLSFGGWTNDNETTYPDINFEQMSDADQQKFAKDAALLVKSLGFDGVDIDWEWWANHRFGNDACTSSVKPSAPYCQGKMVNHDTKKYVNLLKYLRQELGSDKLLTVATVSSASKIKSEEDPSLGGYVGAWKDIESYVNYINIMAYDMHGAFDNITASQAPWDIDAKNDPFYGKPGGVTIKSSIKAYLDAGVPIKKLVLGMPAYGRSSIISSEGATGGLYQASSGAPSGEFDKTGVYTYKCLTQGDCHGGGTKPALTLHTQGSTLFNTYGGYALTPWGSSGNMFMTYDDQNSVRLKLQETCKSFGQLGGGMVWALDGDTKDSTSIVTAIMDNINCK